jgi:para-nitrobenzyl esterase
VTGKRTEHLLAAFLGTVLCLGGIFFSAACTTMDPVGVADSAQASSAKDEGSPLRWSGRTLVSVKAGKLRGLPVNRDVLVWKGIPYAEPPVGELRWKAPRDAAPWKGIRRCCSYGPDCVQYAVFPRNRIKGKEDCLYLNVWRPWNGATDLPVYFWIHGGGNTTGSASYTPDYLGEEFVERTGAVYVSLNYRLGPMGWFTHPALREEAGGNAPDRSGNFGTLDILKALEWVQENIKAFGGNPGNVTVGGESAGAFNIISLLMSGESRGMFHKAIIRSGGTVTASVEEGDKKSSEILRTLLVRDGYTEEEAGRIETEWSSEKLMRYLRSTPAEEILACYTPRHFGMLSIPVIFKDGIVIPAEGGEVLAKGDYPMKVPIIIGTNRDEVKLFMVFNEELRSSREYYAAVTRYASDSWKKDGADALARRMSRHEDQPPVYVYHFRWGTLDPEGDSPLPCRRGFTLGACHGLEVPFFHATVGETFLFELLFFNNMNRRGAEKLEDAVMDYTESFLYHGGPNEGNPGIPRWLPWSNKPLSPKSLVLDAGRKNLRIRMSSTEYTAGYIKETLRSSFSEEIYTKALEYLEEYEVGIESLEHE